VEEFAIPHLVEGETGDVRQLNPGRTEEREILEDEGDGIRAGPEGVFDTSVICTMVVAPFALAEAVVSTKEDPVT
jgi:hypothetical protein